MKLQQLAEKKVSVLIIFTLLVVSVGLLIEAVPLFFTKTVAEPTPDVKPYDALQVASRDIHVRESCYNCHSQMIHPSRAETERYSHYSVTGESVYDCPFQWGSRRTGSDLARVSDCYSNKWHRIRLPNPHDVVPESSMPAFPWFACNKVDAGATVAYMKALRKVGTPYSDEEIVEAPEILISKSELDTVIVYLQGLGLALKNIR